MKYPNDRIRIEIFYTGAAAVQQEYSTCYVAVWWLDWTIHYLPVDIYSIHSFLRVVVYTGYFHGHDNILLVVLVSNAACCTWQPSTEQPKSVTTSMDPSIDPSIHLYIHPFIHPPIQYIHEIIHPSCRSKVWSRSKSKAGLVVRRSYI